MRYAKKNKEYSTLSVAYETDALAIETLSRLETTEERFVGHKLVLLVVVIGMVWVI